jgi:hypothetical protein
LFGVSPARLLAIEHLFAKVVGDRGNGFVGGSV